MMISSAIRWCAALAVAFVAAGAAWAQGAPSKVTIAIFGPPSLGSFLPPVIKAKKFDIGNGLDLLFVERPPDAYAVQFNSGEFQVGGSASALILANARNRGVQVVYLFNVFDFWATLVTSNDEVRTLKDLVGKEIAAARGTTSFAMVDWFARRQGLDLSKAAVLNTAPAGLMSYAMAGRADAVHLWEPGYTQLISKKPTVRTLDLDIKRQWKQFAGSEAMPFLGVAAHEGWIKQNAKLVEPLYRTYKAAAEWVVKNPGEAADLILPKGSDADRLAIKQLIESKERLALNVVGAAAIRKELEFVFDAGLSIKNLDKLPDPGLIYPVPLK